MAYYEGDFKNGLMHGNGMIVFSPADTLHRKHFEGTFVEGKRTGGGRMVYNSNDRFTGELDSQYVPHGVGKKEYSGGKSSYEGEWQNGKAHGSGTLVDGLNTYVGSFVMGNRDGPGQMTYADGARYSGHWADNVQSGEGTLQFANGDIYEGSFSDGVKAGQGKLTYHNGDVLTGLFKEDDAHGPCVKTFVNGEVWTGDYDKGKRKIGKMAYLDGTTYEGQWKEGRPHGRGKLFFGESFSPFP